MSKNTLAVIVSAALLILVLSPLFLAPYLYTMASTQEKSIPQKEFEFSKQYITLIQSHDFEGARKYLNPKIAGDHFKDVFDRLAALFPSEVPKSIKVIGWNALAGKGFTGISLSSEYEFQDKWLLANIVLQRQGDSYSVEGIHINPLGASLEDITRFRFLGQNMMHYIVFAVAIAVLLFNLYTLVLCIKMPALKMKWLWVIFILFGFSALNFDWLSGTLYYNLLVAKVPVIQFSQMLYQPFFIAITFPVGSLIFLFMCRKWAAREQSA